MKKATIILSLFISCAFAAQDTVYNASKFGIRSDGILQDPLKYDRVGDQARLVYFRECQDIHISGICENILTDSLHAVHTSYPGGGDTNVACVRINELYKVPEMPEAYPEFSQHKELPA